MDRILLKGSDVGGGRSPGRRQHDEDLGARVAMACNKNGCLILAVACVAGMLLPDAALAQGELGQIGFRSTPYVLSGASQSTLQQLGSHRGPKAAGRLWDATQFASGGFDNGPFTRLYWWDWDVSRTGHDAEVAGWTSAGSAMRPSGGWAQRGQGPYYLRLRLRINAPILAHASNSEGCDGDTQMKFFLWNSYTSEGTDRVIMMLHDGAFGGGSETNETTVQLRAGVSGSWARTTIPNHQWVHLQLAWQWGPESTGFQRIYANNNASASPNATNNRFDDLDVYGYSDHWGHPTSPQGLDNEMQIGNIANTGSCVREDAQIDIADMEIATQFDPSWYPGGGAGTTTPPAPRNFRIVPADLADAGLPFGVLGVLFAAGGRRRKK